MSISSAMYTGLTGLSANGEAMGVLGDNIANLNTTGFKYSQVAFEDLMAQTVSTGSGPGQEGRGTRISEITPIFSQGSMETSADDVDVAISGTGFFIVREPVETGEGKVYYTRDGNFSLDKDGYLVNAHGYRVQGKQMVNGTPSGTDTNIVIQQNLSPAAPTKNMEMVLNLNSDTAVGDSYPTAMSVYESSGKAHSLNMTFTRGDDKLFSQVTCGAADIGTLQSTYWTISSPTVDYYVWYNVDNLGTDPTLGGTGVEVDVTDGMTADEVATATANAITNQLGTTIFTAIADGADVRIDGATGGTGAANGNTPWSTTDFETEVQSHWTPSATLDGTTTVTITDAGSTTLSDMVFRPDGQFADYCTASYSLDMGSDIGDPITGLTALNLKTTTGGATTQYAMSSVTNYSSQDGYPPGYLQRVSINNEGVITGNYSNGQITPLFQLTLARFNAPTQLHREGSNMYTETQDSGVPLTGQPGTIGLGSIAANSLEQSNVDLGEQFVHMILYQRAFQANSRVITTSDSMLEEVLSLKR